MDLDLTLSLFHNLSLQQINNIKTHPKVIQHGVKMLIFRFQPNDKIKKHQSDPTNTRVTSSASTEEEDDDNEEGNHLPGLPGFKSILAIFPNCQDIEINMLDGLAWGKTDREFQHILKAVLDSDLHISTLTLKLRPFDCGAFKFKNHSLFTDRCYSQKWAHLKSLYVEEGFVRP